MSKENLKVTRKSGVFYDTLTIENKVKVKDVSDYLYSTIKEITEDCDIPEKNIQQVHFDVVRKNSEEKIVLMVRYAKIDLEEFRKLDNSSQLRKALNYTGYNNERIKSIEYRKYWSNSNEKIWVATVYNTNNRFDPDEMYAEGEYYASISNTIAEILDFKFVIDFR